MLDQLPSNVIASLCNDNLRLKDIKSLILTSKFFRNLFMEDTTWQAVGYVSAARGLRKLRRTLNKRVWLRMNFEMPCKVEKLEIFPERQQICCSNLMYFSVNREYGFAVSVIQERGMRMPGNHTAEGASDKVRDVALRPETLAIGGGKESDSLMAEYRLAKDRQTLKVKCYTWPDVSDFVTEAMEMDLPLVKRIDKIYSIVRMCRMLATKINA